MEPQYHCVPNCCWGIVEWPRIEHPTYVPILNYSSHCLMVPRLRVQRLDNYHCDVHPSHGFLHNSTYTQGPCQCYRRSRNRRRTPPDDADWASPTSEQEFDWYMEIALPTGDTYNNSPPCVGR